MASISVRDLLRKAKPVFDQIERDQAPVLITRKGRPFAALVPVDPEAAEAMTLSAAPELIENRNRAKNARAEGRTEPVEEPLDESEDALVTAPPEKTVELGVRPAPRTVTTHYVVEGEQLRNLAKKYSDYDRIGQFAADVLERDDDRFRPLVAALLADLDRFESASGTTAPGAAAVGPARRTSIAGSAEFLLS
jgi:prevent-host-death family protein